MAFKNKIYPLLLGLVATLVLFAPMPTELSDASDKTSEQELSLATSTPQKDRLTLVSFFLIIDDGEILGAAAVYDDITTERPADYVELYSTTGGLMAVSWFDRFGIQRTAVDRALLEEVDELEGVFVLLVEGRSI